MAADNQAYAAALKRRMAPVFQSEGRKYYGKAYKRYRRWARPAGVAPGHNQPGPYQTKLGRRKEQKFERWAHRVNQTAGERILRPGARLTDYDYRGYFGQTLKKRGHVPGYRKGSHFIDKYKTPYDTTFSSESIYANRRNPLVWRGNKLVNKRTGRVFFG